MDFPGAEPAHVTTEMCVTGGPGSGDDKPSATAALPNVQSTALPLASEGTALTVPTPEGAWKLAGLQPESSIAQ